MGSPDQAAPDAGASKLRSAVVHHQAGRFAEAEAIYRELLDAQPDYPGALHMYGVLAYQTNRVDLSIDLIQRAIRLSPHSVACYCNLGNAYKAGGRLPEAVASYRQALAINPEFIDAHLNLGAVLCELDEVDGAIECFRQIIRIAPLHADAHFNIGLLLANRSEPVAAMESFRRAIASRPAFVDAYYNLANALGEAGQPEEALACYREAARLQPERADARWAQALILLRSGDFAAGWPLYEARWGAAFDTVEHRARPHDSGVAEGEGERRVEDDSPAPRAGLRRYPADAQIRAGAGSPGASVIVEVPSSLSEHCRRRSRRCPGGHAAGLEASR